jgi:hypothetical protein
MRALTLPLLVPAFQWFYNLKTEFIYQCALDIANMSTPAETPRPALILIV